MPRKLSKRALAATLLCVAVYSKNKWMRSNLPIIGYGTHYVTCEWDYSGVQTVIVDTGSGANVFPCEECTGCGDSYNIDGYFKQSQWTTVADVMDVSILADLFSGYCSAMA